MKKNSSFNNFTRFIPPEATLFIFYKWGKESASGEEKQKEILDSIHYAKRIQIALLPSEKYISGNLIKLRYKK